VIVPVYNVGEYLLPCLESIAAQTLQDLEVIIIDDGSTDGSGEVADRFAADHEGWRVLHVENGGLGRARNIGLDHATGDYVAFLDSDDIVPRDAYELLLHALRESGSDIASGRVLRYDGARTWLSGLHMKAIPRTALRTHIRKMPSLLYDTTAWNKLYRRDFLEEHGLRFPEGVYYEDIPFTTPAHFLAATVDVLSEPVYLWRQRQTDNLSITQRRWELKNLEDRMTAVTAVDDFLVQHQEKASKREHDRKVLELDLPLFLGVFAEADEAFQKRFMELAGDYLRRVRPGEIKRLTPALRLEYHLILRELLPELLEVLAAERDPKRRDRFRRRGLRMYADLPFLGDADRAVPGWVYDVSRTQPLLTAVQDVRWEGDDLVVEGHAYISHVPLRSRLGSVLQVQLRDVARGRLGARFTVPTRRHRRPEVTAHATSSPISYDWSGFEARIPLSRVIPRPGTSRRTVAVVARLATPWAQRGGPLERPDDGRARHPSRFLTGDGVLVVPTFSSGGLRITATRVPAVVESARVQDRVELTVRRLPDWTPDDGQLYLRRTDALTGFVVPLREGGDGRMHADISFDALGVDAQTVTAHVWQVWLVGPAQRGDEEPPKGRRIKAHPALGRPSNVVRGRQITATSTIEGNFQILDRQPRVTLETYAWDGDAALLLAGGCRGVPFVGLALTHSDGTEIALPTEIDGDRWTLRLPAAGPPASGALCTLRPGRWGIRARVTTEDTATLSVVVAPEVEALLAGWKQLGQHKVAVRSRAGSSLGLTIDADGPWEERGAYRRELLRRRVYPLERRRPLEDVVLFEAWKGRQYSDNPRAIFEELRRRGDPRRMVWAVENHGVEVPAGVETAVRFGRDYYRHLARARWIVSNDSLTPQYEKRRGSTYLQTWHGTPLKRIGFDMTTLHMANKDYLDQFTLEVAKWDKLVSPNRFSTEILRRAFRYDGEVIETGYPRNDVFYRDEEAKRRRAATLERLGIEPGRRVLLYAPTWRDNHYDLAGRYKFDMKLDLEVLHRHFGDDSVLLIRGHQLVANRVGMSLFGGFVRNVSLYPDVADLYLIADVLITDYSSVMFDFANTGRPMLFYTWDLDEYRDELRGFYFDFEAEAPGPLLRTTGGVVEALSALDAVQAGSAERYAAFRQRFCALEDGNAAARVIDQSLLPD
jgi:CDP-glycerol glycerophosphotransferase